MQRSIDSSNDSSKMAKKDVSRRELLERWTAIEEEDDDAASSSHPIKRRRMRQLKEEWFSDAFNFLIYLPKENHIWCGNWDLMGPLLETFYNYFKDESADSPLKLLWNRISKEMRSCAQCIYQHHQAQEMYGTEYELSSIGPLLDVLHTLDEERVCQHLQDLNARIGRGEYDPANHYGEVASVMFEVFSFPILLDDQSLATEFQIFIEAVDNFHDLTLAGNQQYLGVYVLLFLKSRRTRSIGFRLAGHMGKLRRSTDLDPLQYLLKKCIGILESESMQSSKETSRPRVQLDRTAVWLGMKALLGFLEPPAFEEGILDRYPIFLSIVLNHISDDSLEFSHAVNCLRLLFEKLGCKLWLRATLSPSVMRNTLLGQCFHTRNEKIHKEIFDLFSPFLQSLEALQDGEHEKQRRHFLYFLLHQVPVSSNFSMLMRKKACQVALLIVLRGYKMNPPCPPSECAHMWGPFLVSALKDLTLHSSLRQPALDLIQTIIVSDASALISMVLNGQLHSSNMPSGPTRFGMEDDDEEPSFGLDSEENDVSCWKEFSLQNKMTSQVYGEWMCIPMLWFDVLVEIDPLALPLSFSKAVFWTLARFSMVEPENSQEMALPVRNWLSTCGSEISPLFGWKVPSGADDGGAGSGSRNSIRTSLMCLPLVKAFKRLTAHYTVRMEQGELWKQWTWEPMMSDSFFLLLVDPNDNTRRLTKVILEQVSGMNGVTRGLQFLCSSQSSWSAIFTGVRHALRLVQLDSVLLNFQTLHHFFFILCKLLKEGYPCGETSSQKLSEASDVAKFSSQGGFLKQPEFDSSTTDVHGHSSTVSSNSWEKFNCLLSEIAWPAIQKCLAKCKAFIDFKVSQMTCIRLLEITPLVFERLSRNSGTMLENIDTIKWLHDLTDWGKSSSDTVVRYWKGTLASLLGLIKASCSSKAASAISDIEKLISGENLLADEMNKQIAALSCLLLDKGSTLKITSINSKSSPFDASLPRRTFTEKDPEIYFSNGTKVHTVDSEPLVNMEKNDVIVLSDDEEEPNITCNKDVHSLVRSSQSMFADKSVGASSAGRIVNDDLHEMHSTTHGSMSQPEAVCQPGSLDFSDPATHKMGPYPEETIKLPVTSGKTKQSDSERKQVDTKVGVNDLFPLQNNSNRRNISSETINSKGLDSALSKQYPNNKALPDKSKTSKTKDQQGTNKVGKASDLVIKEVIWDTEEDPWEFSFFKPLSGQQTLATRPITSGPKRQVIQLNLPVQNRSGSLRLDGVRRFKPPRLDDWFRPILELDFFVAVGLESGNDDADQNTIKLKEVPVCFQSADEYVEIFRPLVLEEFKAQLRNSFQEMASIEEMCCGSLSVLSIERVDDFHFVRVVHDENKLDMSKPCSESDLILLTRQPLKNSSHDVHIVGKVERREKDNKRRSNILVIRVYLRGCSRLNRAQKLLNVRSKWFIHRVMSITPQLREFQALSSIREIPLLPIVLNPINSFSGHRESRTENMLRLSQPLQQVLKSSYNESQMKAISAAIGPFDSKKDFELSLIQGPPGTGKTRTIVAIVSGLLAFSQMKDNKRLQSYNSKCSNVSSTKQKMSQSAAVARAWQDAALARQLNDDVEKNNKSTGSSTTGRILICAQSNAAVDELVARITSKGLYGRDGMMFKPYLVRVGNEKTVHPNSLPFFIDTLVDNRLAEERRNSNDEKNDIDGDSLTVLRSKLEKLVDSIRYYEAKRANIEERNSNSSNHLWEGDSVGGEDGKELSDAELGAKLRTLYDKKKTIYTDISSAQAKEKKASEEIKSLKHKIRKAILKEAEIVVTTLSGCGGDLYGVCSESISSHKFTVPSESTLFDAVVIDEAAQALEPATLIPFQLLKSRGTKCIMVGDPKQLPATVLSNVASKYMFQCSMFERLQRANHPVTMLTHQYRMHPEICRFPSSHFYDGKLLNGDQMSSKAASFHESRALGPYVFFDIVDGQEQHGKNSATSSSLYNECEADAAVELFKFFKKRYPSDFFGGRIGIITPYKSQLSLLRGRFSRAFGSAITAEIEFNTVDGFQGREVDILLLSTVRAAGPEARRINSSNLGFVADVRRMNVALTRAKLSLWIFGDSRTLRTNPTWASLVADAKERDLIISGTRPYSSMFNCDSGSRPGSVIRTNQSSLRKNNEKIEAANEHVETQKDTVKHTSGRKRKYGIDTQCVNRTGTDEHAFPQAKESTKDNKRRSRDGSNVPLPKDVATSEIVNSKDKNSNSVKPAERGSRVNTEDEHQKNVEKSGMRKGENNYKKRSNLNNSDKRSEGHKHLKHVVTEDRGSKQVKHNDFSRKMETATPSSGKKDEIVGDGVSNQVELPKNSIAKRKQQREAVDALLSSALIPAKKKLESSRKSSSVKRSPPTSSGGHQIRPPKPTKVSDH